MGRFETFPFSSFCNDDDQNDKVYIFQVNRVVWYSSYNNAVAVRNVVLW